MAVTVLNISVDAGTDYFLSATRADYTTNLPVDITGYSALLEVKSDIMSPIPLLVLSSSNGRILLAGPTGEIIVRFAPEDTAMSLQSIFWKRGVYDLILTDRNGVRTKLLKGFINVVGTASTDFYPIVVMTYIAPSISYTSVGTLVAH